MSFRHILKKVGFSNFCKIFKVFSSFLKRFWTGGNFILGSTPFGSHFKGRILFLGVCLEWNSIPGTWRYMKVTCFNVRWLRIFLTLLKFRIILKRDKIFRNFKIFMCITLGLSLVSWCTNTVESFVMFTRTPKFCKIFYLCISCKIPLETEKLKKKNVSISSWELQFLKIVNFTRLNIKKIKKKMHKIVEFYICGPLSCMKCH